MTYSAYLDELTRITALAMARLDEDTDTDYHPHEELGEALRDGALI
jgi:hypothetical protein